MLRNVHLHGEAGDLFGRVFRLDVSSLAEAVRAIGCQVKGFREYLRNNSFRCVRGPNLDVGFELGEDDIEFGLGRSDLHIVPVVEGSGGKGSGIGKIIAGVLLAGVAVWTAPSIMAGAHVGIAALAGTPGVVMGLGLVSAGVSQLLSAQAKPDDKKSDSFGFSGSIATAQQGDVIPLIYGRVMVKNPRVISAGIYSEDIAIGGSN